MHNPFGQYFQYLGDPLNVKVVAIKLYHTWMSSLDSTLYCAPIEGLRAFSSTTVISK